MNRDQAALVPENHQGPRICIISSWNDRYAPLAEIARPNWIAYAQRHGYAIRLYPGEYHEDPSRLETFGDKGKFRLYTDVRGWCDMVMWLDIDSLFTNMDTRIEDIIGVSRFMWTCDENGPLSGLWVARTDDTTEKHLRFAYERAAIENNVRHGVIEPNGISDQDSMTRLMNVPPFVRTFRHCPPAAEVGHCYESNWQPDSWIITFPGMTVEQKISKMKAWAAKI